MNKKVVLMTLHGMGNKKPNYFSELEGDMTERIGASLWAEDVYFAPIFYYDVFQNAQNALYERVRAKVDSKKLREFLLFGFADAGGLEYSRNIPNSAYKAVQELIFDAMGRAYAALGNTTGPVVLIAQSLGCQVISNYIWDAQHHANRPPGIWRDEHAELDPQDLAFRKFGSLRVLVTTGCNIPIFVGGLPRDQIKPISRPHPNFVWENYYDQDDPLGWPLQDLSNEYEALVRDIEVNAGGFLTSWNPLSHGKYWGDSDVQTPLANHLRSLLAEA